MNPKTKKIAIKAFKRVSSKIMINRDKVAQLRAQYEQLYGSSNSQNNAPQQQKQEEKPATKRIARPSTARRAIVAIGHLIDNFKTSKPEEKLRRNSTNIPRKKSSSTIDVQKTLTKKHKSATFGEAFQRLKEQPKTEAEEQTKLPMDEYLKNVVPSMLNKDTGDTTKAVKIKQESLTAFKGELKYFEVCQILRILVTEKKSGCLRVNDIKIFLDKGDIIHCKSPGHEGYEAIYITFFQAHGKFEFIPDETTDQRTIEATLDQLLSAGLNEIEEEEKQDQ